MAKRQKPITGSQVRASRGVIPEGARLTRGAMLVLQRLEKGKGASSAKTST